MKSAYELAMERLDRQHGKVTSLSDKQKAALADIDQRGKAKIAETEILYRDRIKAAVAAGKYDETSQLETEMQTEIARVRDRSEAEKEAVRRDASLA